MVAVDSQKQRNRSKLGFGLGYDKLCSDNIYVFCYRRLLDVFTVLLDSWHAKFLKISNRNKLL